MADFEARNVRIQFPCKHVTLLNCGEGDTFIRPEPRTFCGMFTGCGRISPVVDVTCFRSVLDLDDLDIGANCGEAGTKIPLPVRTREELEVFIRPEELGVLKQLLSARVKEMQDHISHIDDIEGQVGKLG